MFRKASLAASKDGEPRIHDEAVQRLEVVYEAHGLSQDARVKEVALQDLIDTYMTLFLVGSQNFSATSISKERDLIVESYPGWQETRKFTMQVRSSMVADKGSSSDPNFALENFSFRAATEIVEEIGERYGRWQDSECRDLKASLLKSEHAGTGRVLLKDFYSAALGGQWQFHGFFELLFWFHAIGSPSYLVFQESRRQKSPKRGSLRASNTCESSVRWTSRTVRTSPSLSRTTSTHSRTARRHPVSILFLSCSFIEGYRLSSRCRVEALELLLTARAACSRWLRQSPPQ